MRNAKKAEDPVLIRTAYIAADADKRLAEWLVSEGYEVVLTEKSDMVAGPVACHPDMFMCSLGVADEAPIVRCSRTLGPVYPEDIPYNAACTGRYFIHNLKYTAPELRAAAEGAGMVLVGVRQGYAKCSTVIVDEESVITYDRGIAEACKAAGMDVLTVSPGHVLLPGYDTGFIGGASGRVGSIVAFNGDLSAHPDFGRIREFITGKGLGVKWFEEWPLTDIGSIITGTREVTGAESPETAGKL